MNYNPHIHHRKSIRLKGYDYSQAGLYFLTICCDDRKCLFGEITDGIMKLNDAGKIADECWLEIPKHFPNVILHEYIVMPNHVHGIIELKTDTARVQNFEPLPNNMGSNVGVENFQPLRPTEPQRNEFQKIIPRSIGSIVRGYKIGVTKWFRDNVAGANNFSPDNQSPKSKLLWQRNYHEHIIRDEQSYQNISEYIMNNPNNWKDDKFYKKY